jgi:L-2,4-diaminobutyrate decarboxylase
MADLCDELGIWLHVDGAYGYAYKLVPEWAHLFAGDDRADSIIWDPHKQLGAPIPNSVLFVKQRQEFRRMALHSHYFNRPDIEEPNPGLKSPPSTRPMSALALVTIIRGQGLELLVKNLRAPLDAIRSLADYIHTLPEVELPHQPDTGIICFRMTPPGYSEQELDLLQQTIYSRIMSAGKRSISITELGGKKVLRLVVVSPHTSYLDLQRSIEVISTLANEIPLIR